MDTIEQTCEEIGRFLREDVRQVGRGVVCIGPPPTHSTAWGVIALGTETPTDHWLISAENAWERAWLVGDWERRIITIAEADALIEKYG